MLKLYNLGKRIWIILIMAVGLSVLSAGDGNFVAGLLVGATVGAVGVLFLLSEGARKEEKAGKCPTCGK